MILAASTTPFSIDFFVGCIEQYVIMMWTFHDVCMWGFIYIQSISAT